MLHRIANLAITAPRLVVTGAIVLFVVTTAFGGPVVNRLSAGGFQDPAAESSQAVHLLSEKFGHGDLQVVFMLTADDGVDSDAARLVSTKIVNQLRTMPFVGEITTTWTAPDAGRRDLTSNDGRSGLVIANITGGGTAGQRHAKAFVAGIDHPRDGVTVRVGGSAMAYVQINAFSQRDLVLMESIAIPLSFAVLVWVFGGLLAAALPLVMGLLAIVGAMAVLRIVAAATPVTTFAVNLTVAMGLALAIDYTLLLVSRYRSERADGADVDAALVTTMATAGRTVVFSAATVAFSMAALLLFPMYFLKSFAFAGVTVVTLTAATTVVVTPAAIVLLGDRIDAYDARRLLRRWSGRGDPAPKRLQQSFWYRSAKFAMRRAFLVGIATAALLLLLGAPFLGVRWGFPDDRLLPSSASAHVVGDALRNDFPHNPASAVTVVIPDAAGVDAAAFDRYAAELSGIDDVPSVSAPGGTFVDGARAGPPTAATGIADGSAFLTIASSAPLFSPESETQLERLRGVTGPDGRHIALTGTAQIHHDSAAAINARLPAVLTLIAAITFGLLFLLTGSIVLPLKALVLNVLSLTAAFGALVWIFQDGHLAALGTTATGTIIPNIPVLLFCIAFGVSMDYEVFLIARIHEYWLASGQTRADHDESIALGLARVGRVVTAAAAVMSISFAALIAAQLSIARMIGLGLTLAVLMDATLVRMLLVPVSMHALGRFNWWAPWPLNVAHRRFGISEHATAAEPSSGRHAMRIE